MWRRKFEEVLDKMEGEPYWSLLVSATSAILSKAAWGALREKNSQLMIRSYEFKGVSASSQNSEVVEPSW